ncbi:MAG: hypothetical protein IJY08_05405 [Clostridia bacterium]|nr:hypothetical protein [Clostridia bacterium]
MKKKFSLGTLAVGAALSLGIAMGAGLYAGAVTDNYGIDLMSVEVTDGASFEEYKTEQIAEAKRRAALVSGASSEDAVVKINALEYDDSKTADENKALVDDIMTDLNSQIFARKSAIISTDIMIYERQIETEMSGEGIPVSTIMLSISSKAIEENKNCTYDSSLSIEDNLLKLDDIYKSYTAKADAQKTIELSAKSAFDTYKSNNLYIITGKRSDANDDNRTELNAFADKAYAEVSAVAFDVNDIGKGEKEIDAIMARFNMEHAYLVYRDDVAAKIDAALPAEPSAAMSSLIANARAEVIARTWDASKTLEDNKAELDAIYNDFLAKKEELVIDEARQAAKAELDTVYATYSHDNYYSSANTVYDDLEELIGIYEGLVAQLDSKTSTDDFQAVVAGAAAEFDTVKTKSVRDGEEKAKWTSDNADILAKAQVTSADIGAIEKALDEYASLLPAVKTALSAEYTDLQNKLAAASWYDTHSGIIEKDIANITSADVSAATAALNAYDSLTAAQRDCVPASVVDGLNRKAFEAYRDSTAEKIDAITTAGESAAVKTLIDDAKIAVQALGYPGSYTSGKSALDSLYNDLINDIEYQKLAEANDEEYFNKYKRDQISTAQGLKYGESSAVARIVDAAVSNINAVTYNINTGSAPSIAQINAIMSQLRSDVAAQKLMEDKQAFEVYRDQIADIVDGKHTSDESFEMKAIIDDALEDVESYIYDTYYSLSVNKTQLDVIVSRLESDMLAQQLTEDKAEFEEYRQIISDTAESKHTDDESEDMRAIIDNAVWDIENYSYDESMTLDDNKAVLDSILAGLESDIFDQQIKEDEKAAFENYKNTVAEAVKNKHTEGESEDMKAIIDAAEKAVADYTYDDNMSFEDNKAALDAIVDELDDAIADQLLKEDKAKFEEYRETVAKDAAAKHTDDESAEKKAIIDAAEKAIADYAYDDGKTLEDNKKALDAIVDDMNGKLASQSVAEDKAAFEEYRAAVAATVKGKHTENESDAMKAIIDAAEKAVAEYVYDESKTLADNKAALDAIVTALESDMAKQSLAEDKAAFEAYRGTVSDTVESKHKDGESEEMKSIINTALKEITEYTYDESKSLEENKSALDVILARLTDEMAAQKQLDDDKAAFESHREAVSDIVTNKHGAADSEEIKSIIDAAEKAVKDYVYDDTKTLEENKAALDKLVTDLEAKLTAQREAELKAEADRKARNATILWVVIVIIVLLAAAGVAVFIIIKKKKEANNEY